MAKLRSKKSVVKRFNVTSCGKILHRTAGFAHLLAKKSSRNKQRRLKYRSLSFSTGFVFLRGFQGETYKTPKV